MVDLFVYIFYLFVQTTRHTTKKRHFQVGAKCSIFIKRDLIGKQEGFCSDMTDYYNIPWPRNFLSITAVSNFLLSFHEKFPSW